MQLFKVTSILLVSLLFSGVSQSKDISAAVGESAAFEQVYTERGKSLDLTKQEFKEKLVLFIQLQNAPAAQAEMIAKYAQDAEQALKEYNKNGKNNPETIKKILKSANLAKAEEANYLGLRIEQLESFKSAASYFQYLLSKKQ